MSNRFVRYLYFNFGHEAQRETFKEHEWRVFITQFIYTYSVDKIKKYRLTNQAICRSEVRTSFVITATATEPARKSRISICIMNCGHCIKTSVMRTAPFDNIYCKYNKIHCKHIARLFRNFCSALRALRTVYLWKCTLVSPKKKDLHFNTPVLTVPGVITVTRTWQGHHSKIVEENLLIPISRRLIAY
jgi:hypothetical protein